MLSVALTSIFIFIWSSAIILPLSKRAAHLALPLLQPEHIRSGFMRFVLHCSIPQSQKLKVSEGLHFSAMVCLHLVTQSPFYPVTASSQQIISFSPMANWITRKGAQSCVCIWLVPTLNVLMNSHKSQSVKQTPSQCMRGCSDIFFPLLRVLWAPCVCRASTNTKVFSPQGKTFPRSLL